VAGFALVLLLNFISAQGFGAADLSGDVCGGRSSLNVGSLPVSGASRLLLPNRLSYTLTCKYVFALSLLLRVVTEKVFGLLSVTFLRLSRSKLWVSERMNT
jgi:hypothetical protein